MNLMQHNSLFRINCWHKHHPFIFWLIKPSICLHCQTLNQFMFYNTKKCIRKFKINQENGKKVFQKCYYSFSNQATYDYSLTGFSGDFHAGFYFNFLLQVEDFWALYNHIELASRLQAGCDYSLFKEGVKPMWEDERYFVINVGEIYINNAEFIATMEQF